MKTKVFIAKRSGVNRFGVRKWGLVLSRTRPGVLHKVIKIRKRGTRNYRYACSCEDFTNRQVACFHIKQFKKLEVK